MFTVSILNVSIWILSGILLLFAIVLIILRLLKIDIFSKLNQNNKKKDVGTVSKDMQQIVLSLGSIDGLNVGYNILIKNKFSKDNYSLIPAIIVEKGKIFMLTNRIKVSKFNIIFNNEKKVIVYKGQKGKEDPSFKYKWYKETIKYIKSISNGMDFELLVPVVGQIDKIENKSDLKLIESSEIGEYIKKHNGKPSTIFEKKFLQKLDRENMFKKAASLDRKRAERLLK